MRHFPPQCQLEARHGVVPGDGDIVLLRLGELLDLHGVVEHGPDLGLILVLELVHKDHLCVVVVEAPDLRKIYLCFATFLCN